MLETQQCGKQRGGCSDPRKGQDMKIRKTEGKEQKSVWRHDREKLGHVVILNEHVQKTYHIMMYDDDIRVY